MDHPEERAKGGVGVQQKKRDAWVQSVERAFRILQLFDLKRDELSITEISERTGLPLSTAHRFLATLEGLGYIWQNPDTGRYRLGIQTFILGTRVKTLETLRSVARPHLRQLFAKYNETVNLVVERNMEVLCIEKVDADRRLVYTPSIGETHKLYATSAGKCILAFYYDAAQLRRVLDQMELVPLTPHTITEKARLVDEIERVRKQGWAMETEESEIGLRCFGAPVFDSANRCVGAVSISIPVARFVYDEAGLIADIKETAAAISRDLGAERIVETARFEAEPDRTDIPGFLVEAVVHAPGGAAPGSCAGHYDIDDAQVRAFQAVTGPEELGRYLEQMAAYTAHEGVSR